MNRKSVRIVILRFTALIAVSFCINPNITFGAPATSSEAMKCTPDDHLQTQSVAEPALPSGKVVNQPSSAVHPKVVFQINQAEDASTILRFVTNYLIAEPTAEIAVVGYNGGANFMLKGANDSAGRPYADQLQSLAGRGVHFKICNNTLKARNLSADAVISQVQVVPGAVNEIIRLQTREGYAYFRH